MSIQKLLRDKISVSNISGTPNFLTLKLLVKLEQDHTHTRTHTDADKM